MKQEVPIKSTEFMPKQEYLLVKPMTVETEKKTDSGLVISLNKSSLERPSMGEVLEVGSDIEDIKSGDTVLWPATDGLDFEFTDGDFVLLRYASVIGMKK
jgi:co-chaperonin GroES (HSP10)